MWWQADIEKTWLLWNELKGHGCSDSGNTEVELATDVKSQAVNAYLVQAELCQFHI